VGKNVEAELKVVAITSQVEALLEVCVNGVLDHLAIMRVLEAAINVSCRDSS